MKKKKMFGIVSVMFVIVIMFGNISIVYAKQLNNTFYKTVQLRAGGGSSGSSSGGSSSGGSSSGHTGSHSRSSHYGPGSIISDVLFYIFLIFTTFSTIIVLYIKVLRASFNSKKYLKILDNKDIAWNYKTIEKQVIETFYIVQEAWTQMDMTRAKYYMDDDLYDSFSIKLEWMQYSHKRNILKKIRLVNLKPVSVHDDLDDTKDLIWFYIKGKMIDYTINTETNEKIDGNEYSKSFVEFWKFIRKDNNKWVLSKILQEDESSKIEFQ